jgi:sugar phosphate isomerase/epimerase
VRFAICNEIFEGWKLEEAMAFVSRAGYDAIEIAPFTIAPNVNAVSAAERQRIQEMARDHALQISGIHWVLAQTEGLHLTHPSESIRRTTSQYFCDLVQFCADLGGRFMIVGSPKQRNLLPGVSPEQACEWATEVFREPVSRARDLGVTICFEPLAVSESNFINTAAEAIRFTQRLNSAHFKIILDVKAMCSEANTIPQIIRESAPHFAYFHANDANLKGPGFGKIDFKPIAKALKETGYEGFVSVEVFQFEEGPEMIATKSLEYLKKCFA